MKLNLGCGYKPEAGYINVDARSLPGVDVVWDLNRFGWPWNDETVEQIRAIDVFEHLDDLVAVLGECWRVLAPGGQLYVQGPSPRSPNLWVDVTHKRALTARSFDHFDWSTPLGEAYRYGSHSWRIIARSEDQNETRITMEKPAEG